jgi:type I restriction enzyme S subunit
MNIGERERVTQNRDEQTTIAQILSDMDAEIESLERKLGKFKLIKQGMMQELLTGKTRLV